jgi:transcriptional regulator with XRE-family HTH domain
VPQPELGRRLRALRRKRGHSLGEVAEKTGISKSFLSLVEVGNSDISVGRLMRLTSFYDADLTDILPSLQSSSPLIVRKEQQTMLDSPDEGIRTLILGPTRRDLLAMRAHFAPGSETSEPRSHEGLEFALAVRGRMAIRIEGDPEIVLEEGEAVYFDSSRPHSYANAGRGEAELLSVSTPPAL